VVEGGSGERAFDGTYPASGLVQVQRERMESLGSGKFSDKRVWCWSLKEGSISTNSVDWGGERPVKRMGLRFSTHTVDCGASYRNEISAVKRK